MNKLFNKNKKLSKKAITEIVAIVMEIFFTSSEIFFASHIYNNKLFTPWNNIFSFLIGILVILDATYLIYMFTFNDEKYFRRDTNALLITFLVVIAFPILILIAYVSFNGTEIKEDLPKQYFYGALIIIYISACFFLINYLIGCRKILHKIGKNHKLLDPLSMKSLLVATLNWFSVFTATSNLSNGLRLIYLLVSVGVSFIYPIFDIFDYVKTEIVNKQKEKANDSEYTSKIEKLVIINKIENHID